MKSGIVIATVFFAFACNQKENNKIMPVNSTDTIDTEKDKAADKEANTQHRDTINMKVQDEKGSYNAIGEIDSIHPRIYVKFTNQAAINLHAVITPIQGEGNIRFDQILFPNKTADGPFGKEIALKLKQTGEYTLIIGHSLMAENPYSGKFKIEIEITNYELLITTRAN